MDDISCSSNEIKYAVFNDRFLLTVQNEESNPIAKRFYCLHEWIMFLCEVIKTSVDQEGQAQKFFVCDEEGPLETWGIATSVLSIEFKDVTEFVQDNKPELLTCIEEARSIYAVMQDSALRTFKKAVIVKGIDYDAEGRKFHLEQKRLSLDLEKAAAPILLAANKYKGKPFPEPSKAADVSISSTLNSCAAVSEDVSPVWSKPISKKRMMDALGIDSLDTFNSYSERIGIKQINHKIHQIRLDKLQHKDREKIEKA